LLLRDQPVNFGGRWWGRGYDFSYAIWRQALQERIPSKVKCSFPLSSISAIKSSKYMYQMEINRNTVMDENIIKHPQNEPIL